MRSTTTTSQQGPETSITGKPHTPELIDAREGAIRRPEPHREKARERGDLEGVERWEEKIAVLRKWRERD